MFYQNTLLFVYNKGEDMRFKIMFGVTSLILLYLLFYPSSYYLGKFKNNITVNYSDFKFNKECDWTYKISNDNIKLKSKNNKIWIYEPNKDGNTTLNFYCTDEDNKIIYNITYKLKIKDKTIYWLESSGEGLLDFPNLY